MAKDSIPSIPPVPATLTPSERQFLQAVKDALSVRAGQTKNYLDHSPTVRELSEMGLVSVGKDGRARPNPGGGGTLPPGEGGGGTPWDPNIKPGKPTGFIVLASPWMHFLKWDDPPAETYYYYSHTEIWATTNEGLTPPVNDRDQAVLLATSAGPSYARSIESQASAYYWIRHITYRGREGDWSSGVNEGVYVASAPDPETVLRTISGQIKEGHLYQDLNSRIDYIDITDGGLVQGLTNEIANRLAGDAALSGRLESLEEGTQSLTSYRNRFEGPDLALWQTGAGATLVSETGTVFQGAGAGLARYTGSVPTPGNTALYLPLDSQYAVVYAGTAVDFNVFVRSAAGIPSTQFAMAYALSDGRHSDWEVFSTPGNSWKRYTVTWNIPPDTEELTHYICILADYAGAGGGIYVDEATTNLSLDLSGIATNAQAIQQLTGRVTTAEGKIDANAGQITVIKATVEDPVTGNAALAINVESNTSRVTSAEGEITSLTQRSTALETTVNNPSKGVVANANNITNHTARIESNEQLTAVHSSQISTINGTLIDHGSGIEANTSAITGITTDIIRLDDSIQVNAAEITALGVRLDDTDNEIGDNAAAIRILETDVSLVDGKVSAISQEMTQLQTTVDGNTTAINLNMSSIDGIQGKFAVKIDTNGYVAGFGLISEPNEEGVQTSQFGVSADKFWVGHPNGDPDASLAFVVANNRVAMHGADIVEGTITTAHLETAIIKEAYIDYQAVVESHIRDGSVTNQKIGSVIESQVVDFSQGVGWRIDKTGHIRASQFTLYDDTGQVILASGPEGASYFDRIDNDQQSFQKISGLPDSLDYIAISRIPNGAYGNVTMELIPTSPSTDTALTFHGNTLYFPNGSKLYDPNIEGAKIILRSTATAYQPYLFIIFTQTPQDQRFPGWTYDGSTTANAMLVTYSPKENVWTAHNSYGTKTWTYEPASSDCILATVVRENNEWKLTSVLAADIQLINEGRPSPSTDNLLYDPLFDGVEADGYNLSYKNWWEGWGPATGEKYGGEPVISLAPSNAGAAGSNGSYFAQPDDKQFLWPRCKPGENIFFGVRLTHTALEPNGRVYLKAHFYDENYEPLPGGDIELSRIQAVSDNIAPNWQLYTGVAEAPGGARYFRVSVWNDRPTSRNSTVKVRGLYAGRSPQEIAPHTAATYIKNLAVDTLQLANQAVTHSEGIWGSKVVASSSAAVDNFPSVWYRCFTIDRVISAPNVPVMINIQMDVTSDTDGTSYKAVRLLRLGTSDGGVITELDKVHIFGYTGGSNYLPLGGPHRIWIDSTHGGGPCKYAVEVGAIGTRGVTVNDIEGFSMELKK